MLDAAAVSWPSPLQSVCGSFADRYVEYELLLVVLDLTLHSRPLYRHLLYNTQLSSVTAALWRLVPVYIVLAACLRHAQAGLLPLPSSLPAALHSFLAADSSRAVLVAAQQAWRLTVAPPAIHAHSWALSWLQLVVTVCSDFALYYAAVLSLALMVRRGRGGVPAAAAASGRTGSVVGLSWWRCVLLSLLLSSFPVCLVVLLLLWEYETSFTLAIQLLMLSSNAQALSAAIPCQTLPAAAIVAAAALTTRLASAALAHAVSGNAELR